MADETITREEAGSALEVLLEQERILSFGDRFGSAEALELGRVAASLAPDYAEGYCVEIWRESDGCDLFRWIADDKAERNYVFAAGKRNAALASGHASPYAQLEALSQGRPLDEVWARVPEVVPSCGAFPIRAGGAWVATIAVSGLHEGLDHEVLLRALEQVLHRRAPRFDVRVA